MNLKGNIKTYPDGLRVIRMVDKDNENTKLTIKAKWFPDEFLNKLITWCTEELNHE